jgi:hypothetical protein
MSDTSGGESSWWDETVQAVEQTYDSAVQTVEQTYDSAVDTYDATVQTVTETYDSAVQTVEQTYDSAVESAEEAYQWAADNAGYATDNYGAGGAPGYDDDGTEGGSAESHTFEEILEFALHHGSVHLVDMLVHATLKVAHGVVTLGVMVFEIATGPGDTSLHNLQFPSYVASCDGDHDGACWSGPYRKLQAEAEYDMVSHQAEWPDHDPAMVVNEHDPDTWGIN